MNTTDQQRFEFLYQQHLTNLTLQGKRPATIDAYSRAVRRLAAFFDRSPDTMTAADLKQYFASLIATHSWSTVKLDRNGLQFFYRYTLDRQWEWLNIVKPPQVKRLPDILTSTQVGWLISMTVKCRYQVFFLVKYTLGLRLSEGLPTLMPIQILIPLSVSWRVGRQRHHRHPITPSHVSLSRWANPTLETAHAANP